MSQALAFHRYQSLSGNVGKNYIVQLARAHVGIDDVREVPGYYPGPGFRIRMVIAIIVVITIVVRIMMVMIVTRIVVLVTVIIILAILVR